MHETLSYETDMMRWNKFLLGFILLCWPIFKHFDSREMFLNDFFYSPIYIYIHTHEHTYAYKVKD